MGSQQTSWSPLDHLGTVKTDPKVNMQIAADISS